MEYIIREKAIMGTIRSLQCCFNDARKKSKKETRMKLSRQKKSKKGLNENARNLD